MNNKDVIDQTVEFKKVKDAQFGVHLVRNGKESDPSTNIPVGTKIKQTFKGDEFVGGQIGIGCFMNTGGAEGKSSASSATETQKKPDCKVNIGDLIQEISRRALIIKEKDVYDLKTNYCEEIFRPIFHELCDSTRNPDVVANILYSDECITRFDREKIENEPQTYKRNKMLYELLLNNNAGRVTGLLKALKGSGNDHILARLEEHLEAFSDEN